ncbi:MAG: hypothetical protein ACXWPJ_03395, partial [Candidatus Limnocylindrales bacterium]
MDHAAQVRTLWRLGSRPAGSVPFRAGPKRLVVLLLPTLLLLACQGGSLGSSPGPSSGYVQGGPVSSGVPSSGAPSPTAGPSPTLTP